MARTQLRRSCIPLLTDRLRGAVGPDALSSHQSITVATDHRADAREHVHPPPPGNYDRLFDFGRAVTGNLFFVPSATFLEEVTQDATAAAIPRADASASEASQRIPTVRDGSLGIGSLKGNSDDE
jgi:hypothetical protein